MGWGQDGTHGMTVTEDVTRALKAPGLKALLQVTIYNTKGTQWDSVST